MINRLTKLLILCILLSVPLSSGAAPFKDIVVFGDSLSDNGNLAIVPGFEFLNQSPYNHGFTNGEPAVLQLAKLLNITLTPSLYLSGTVLGNNFAVAGARAAGAEIKKGIDLLDQVGAFLAKTGGDAPGDTLYIIFIGGNDIRDMRDQKNEKKAGFILKKAAQNISFVISQLIASGARNFLVVNSPDIGRLPETRLIAQATGNPGLILRANLKTRAYNETLAQTVNFIEKRNHIDIVLFDIFTFFNAVVRDSGAYLFANAREACFSSDTFTYYPICKETKLDDFVFFDEIHPTKRVHERVSRGMFAVVPETDVPVL